MGEYEKLYEHIMLRRSDSNVPFTSLCGLLERLGFNVRIKGDPQSAVEKWQVQAVPS
jgi:hypothetical protein